MAELVAARPVVNAYLSGASLVVLHRLASGEVEERQTRPEYAFYVPIAKLDRELERDLARSQAVRSIRQEGGWFRISVLDRFVREDLIYGRRRKDGGTEPSPFLAQGIPLSEGDVHPARRWMADSAAKVQRPRRCFLDIETDSRVPFSCKEEARILSWAVVASDGTSCVEVLEVDSDLAERSLLLKLWMHLQRFDQVLAWNGDNFDFPVVRARTEHLGVGVQPDRWLWLDHLALFKKMNMHAAESGDEKQSMALQSIATAILGEGKDSFDSSKTWEAWAAGGEERERLARYNLKDTDLLRRIEEKTGFASLLDTIAEVCGVFPDSRGLQPTVQMDGYMLRLGSQRHVHFPTRRRFEGKAEQYKGAYVMEPKARGVETDVHVCDFASLYPSIMLSWNMSPETKASVPQNGPIPDGFCRASTGQGFRNDESGILIEALKEVLRLRQHYKDLKASLPPGTPEWVDADRLSNAYKIIANSFYGVLGSPWSRFFDRNIAEAITQTAKWLLLQVMHEAEARGMRAIYSDTDSVYVQGVTATEFEAFVRWCNAELFPGMVAKQGCRENHIKLAYEKQFGRIVFVSSKRYAGNFVHYGGKAATKDSKPEIKGLEFKRGDANKIARVLQEQVIQRVIVDGDSVGKSCRALVEQALRRVLNDPLHIDEVKVSKSVTKPLDEYVVKKKKDGEDGDSPPHVRVARVLAARGQDVNEGTRVAYVVLDGDGGINAVAPAEDYEGELDRHYLWEHLVYPPTQRFLQAAFPDSDWTEGLERTRPPKPRSRGRKVPEGQLGFVLDGDPGDVFVLHLSARYLDVLEHGDPIRILGEHPGVRPLVLHLHLESGEVAVLKTTWRVSGAPRFVGALAEAIWEAAAKRSWEEEIRCAS